MLFGNRWEQLLGMRDRIDQVQVFAWNDYGESIYLNDLRGDMPPEARAFANSDCTSSPFSLRITARGQADHAVPHTDILSLQAFYSAAWKSGKFPAISKDQIWMMTRPHAAGINIAGAPLPAPDNRDLVSHTLGLTHPQTGKFANDTDQRQLLRPSPLARRCQYRPVLRLGR